MSEIKLVTDSSAVLGAALIKLRTMKGMKQNELAAAMEVGSSTWSRIEKGESKLSIDQLKKVANILGVTPSYILEMAELGEKESTRKGVPITVGIIGLAAAGAIASPALMYLCGMRLAELIFDNIDRYKSNKESCKAKET